MKIRKSCHYYEWFGDYSLDCCNNPKRKSDFSTDGCKDCPYYITNKQYRVREIKAEIVRLGNELIKLQPKSK